MGAASLSGYHREEKTMSSWAQRRSRSSRPRVLRRDDRDSSLRSEW